ncbi:response regulator transcription factor [Streptomyces sp. JJ38]|nr:response regulator transcription factor [Streptomyces sp. JJ38]
MLEARALIDSTVSLHRRRPADGPLVVPAGEADAGVIAERLLKRARKSVSASVCSDEEQSLSAFEALSRYRPRSAARSAGGGAATRRPTVRLLCGPDTVEAANPPAAEFREPGCEIRVLADGPPEMIVIDQCFALIKAAPELPGRIAIVKDPASVRALEMLFACSWAGAHPLDDHLRFSQRLSTPLALGVLERLRQGHTDDVAARELHVSLRTYRRHVAAVMSELGVTSRFQAGVRAVQLGLLPRRRPEAPVLHGPSGDHEMERV